MLGAGSGLCTSQFPLSPSLLVFSLSYRGATAAPIVVSWLALWLKCAYSGIFGVSPTFSIENMTERIDSFISWPVCNTKSWTEKRLFSTSASFLLLKFKNLLKASWAYYKFPNTFQKYFMKESVFQHKY